MKLLFLTPQLPYPPRQGTTIRNFNLIRELAQRHTLDLLTFLAPGEELTADSELHHLCRRIAAVPQPQRSTQRRARDTLLTLTPDMGLRLESPAMHALAQAWLATEAYAILQVEGIELIQYAPRSLRPAGPAVIFDEHNCEYLLQQRNAFTDLRQPRRWVAAGYSLVQWQKLRRYEAAALAAADATVAVSDADRDALAALAPGVAVTVVSNGITPEEYAVAAPGAVPLDPPRIVFTGKMDYRPNIDAALWFAGEVLPRVLVQEPAARFQIVGMNPHPRLDVLRSHPNVEITGAVADTRPYMAAAAAYVIPMRVGGGTRFKALEAMASGKAIVSTTLGVEGIPATNGQELLLADEPAAFAAAVVRLIGDLRSGGSLQAGLGRLARRFVEQRYSWHSIVPRLEDVYTQAVRGRSMTS